MTCRRISGTPLTSGDGLLISRTTGWWNWSAEKLARAQPYIAQNDAEKFLAWAASEAR